VSLGTFRCAADRDRALAFIRKYGNRVRLVREGGSSPWEASGWCRTLPIGCMGRILKMRPCLARGRSKGLDLV